MANVLFKRGLQSNLPASTSATDGVFYLTTDTNRLYVGQGNNLKLLNQTVQIVDNINNLPTNWTGAEAVAHTNDFFYCVNPNVLAVWDGTEWKQINKNTDTTIDGAEFGTSASGGVTTVSYTITDSAGTATVASFGIEGAGGITASTTGDNVLLTGTTYSLGRTVDGDHNEASIVLTDSSSTTSGAVIKGGDNVTIASTGTTGIMISAQDTTIDGAELSVSSGAVTLVITDSEGASTTATTTGVGVILNDGSRVLLTDASGVTSVGAIYSKDEIDTMIKGLDGMTYQGTIASAATVATVHTLPTQNVRRGDVYVVSDNFLTVSDLGSGTIAELAGELSNGIRTGDMFIASGDEGSDGYITGTPQWTYVPSGNDSLSGVTYAATVVTATNALNVVNGDNDGIMGIRLVASTGVNVISDVGNVTENADGKQLVATISHAEYTTTSTSANSASTSSFNAITGLTVDNGHVTGYAIEKFTPMTYTFGTTRSDVLVNGSVVDGTRMATATNSGPNDITFASTLNNSENDAIASSVIKISSDTIKLSKGTNANDLVMNMEWGTF